MRSSPLTSPHSAAGRGDTVLLGRLGSELALIYHDTLQAPLPAPLRALIDRLESAIGNDDGSASGQREGRAGSQGPRSHPRCS